MIGKKNKTRKTEIIIKKLWKHNKKNFFRIIISVEYTCNLLFLNQYINISKIEIAKTCFTPRKAPFI